MFLKIIHQVKVELKHNFLPLGLVNLIIIAISYFIFGLKNLDRNIQAIIVERFLPLIGIFNLASLFYWEEKEPIKDILIMRRTSLELIYFIRFIVRFLIYGLTSLIYIYLIGEEFSLNELAKVLFHSISIGALIGIIGLLVFALSKNISLAFLSSIGLILAQWFLPKNKLGILILFTMPNISLSRIIFILGISLVILISSIEIWKRKV